MCLLQTNCIISEYRVSLICPPVQWGSSCWVPSARVVSQSPSHWQRTSPLFLSVNSKCHLGAVLWMQAKQNKFLLHWLSTFVPCQTHNCHTSGTPFESHLSNWNVQRVKFPIRVYNFVNIVERFLPSDWIIFKWDKTKYAASDHDWGSEWQTCLFVFDCDIQFISPLKQWKCDSQNRDFMLKMATIYIGDTSIVAMTRKVRRERGTHGLQFFLLFIHSWHRHGAELSHVLCMLCHHHLQTRENTPTSLDCGTLVAPFLLTGHLHME